MIVIALGQGFIRGEGRIELETLLSARGLVRTDESPDLILVDTFRGRNEAKHGTAYGDNYIYKRKALATISLVAIDRVETDTVWAVSREVNVYGPSVAGRKIVDAVRKMMLSFPRER